MIQTDKGHYWLTFENGYKISIFNGYGSYSENHFKDELRHMPEFASIDSGNYNYDSYMLGLYNGMEYIISLFETREPIYISGKDIEFLRDKNQQKEFINYLENEKDRLAIECIEKDYYSKIQLILIA